MEGAQDAKVGITVPQTGARVPQKRELDARVPREWSSTHGFAVRRCEMLESDEFAERDFENGVPGRLKASTGGGEVTP